MSQPLLNPTIPAGQEERVGALLDAVQEFVGFVPDGLRLFTLSPSLLETFIANLTYFNSESAVGPQLAAMIRYLVSYRADCNFCIDLNEGFLVEMGADLDAVRAARHDLDAAPVAPHELPLLRLAVAAVDDPRQVGADHLQAARQAGWSDRDIFDTVAMATSNRAFNLILHTFKVDRQGVFGA